MSPNCPQLDSIRAPGMQNGGKLPFIAYSEHLQSGKVELYNIERDSRLKKFYDSGRSQESSTQTESYCEGSPGKHHSSSINVDANFPISILKFNLNGTYLASSSSSDNIIKIYQV